MIFFHTLRVFSVIYILSVRRIDSDCDWEKRPSELFSPLTLYIHTGNGLKNKEQSYIIHVFLSMLLFMVLCIAFLAIDTFGTFCT